MNDTKNLRLSDFVPINRNTPGVVIVPSILTGKVAEIIGQLYASGVRDRFGGNAVLNDAIKYDSEEDTLTHSTFLGLNVLGQLIRAENPAFDVTNLRDLMNPDVAALIEGGTYLDSARELVLRGTNKFSNSRDKTIFSQLAAHVDNLETPVLVRGVRVEHSPEDNKGYGLKVVPVEGEFCYLHDARLSQEGRFTSCDEHDLPILDSQGEFRWLVSDYAISGLYRGESGLVADRDLAGSYGDGRVALVSRVASAPNLDRILDTEARDALLGSLTRARTTRMSVK